MFTDKTSQVQVTREDHKKLILPFSCTNCKSTFLHKYQLRKHDVNNCKETTPLPLKQLNKQSKTYKILKQLKIQEQIIKNKPSISVNNQELDKVYKFRFLGHILSSDNNPTITTAPRIEKATHVLWQLRKLVSNQHLNLEYRRNIVMATVIPIALYGSEAWKLNDPDTIKKLNQLSRSIKRVLSEDLTNFRVKIDHNDMNLLTIAHNRKQRYLKQLKDKNKRIAGHSPALIHYNESFVQDIVKDPFLESTSTRHQTNPNVNSKKRKQKKTTEFLRNLKWKPHNPKKSQTKQIAPKY